MDQDINFQHKTAFDTSAVTTYFRIPYRCTVREITGVVQADPGDNETITVTAGATAGAATTAIGTITFGESIAPGAIGVWTEDVTTGGIILEKDSILKFVTSDAAAADCDLNIELDPYAR